MGVELAIPETYERFSTGHSLEFGDTECAESKLAQDEGIPADELRDFAVRHGRNDVHIRGLSSNENLLFACKAYPRNVESKTRKTPSYSKNCLDAFDAFEFDPAQDGIVVLNQANARPKRRSIHRVGKESLELRKILDILQDIWCGTQHQVAVPSEQERPQSWFPASPLRAYRTVEVENHWFEFSKYVSYGKAHIDWIQNMMEMENVVF